MTLRGVYDFDITSHLACKTTLSSALCFSSSSSFHLSLRFGQSGAASTEILNGFGLWSSSCDRIQCRYYCPQSLLVQRTWVSCHQHQHGSLEAPRSVLEQGPITRVQSFAVPSYTLNLVLLVLHKFWLRPCFLCFFSMACLTEGQKVILISVNLDRWIKFFKSGASIVPVPNPVIFSVQFLSKRSKAIGGFRSLHRFTAKIYPDPCQSNIFTVICIKQLPGVSHFP